MGTATMMKTTFAILVLAAFAAALPSEHTSYDPAAIVAEQAPESAGHDASDVTSAPDTVGFMQSRGLSKFVEEYIAKYMDAAKKAKKDAKIATMEVKKAKGKVKKAMKARSLKDFKISKIRLDVAKKKLDHAKQAWQNAKNDLDSVKHCTEKLQAEAKKLTFKECNRNF